MTKKCKNRADIQKLALSYKKERTERNFSALIEALECPLYVFISGYITGYDNIRVVMAQTYENIWNKFDTYDDKYKFITWSFSIARNVALNNKRAEKHKTSIFDNDGHEPCGGDFSDLTPSDAILREQFIESVIKTVKGLQEPYMTVMYLKDIKGLRTQDISKLLCDNASTIRWRLFKARKIVADNLTIQYPYILDCLRNKQN